MINIISVNCLIKGHVQGIGYRFFVQKEAVKHGLTGWVRNLNSGDVEAVVEGFEKDINDFLVIIEHKHPWANVDGIIKNNIKVQNYKDFQIVP